MKMFRQHFLQAGGSGLAIVRSKTVIAIGNQPQTVPMPMAHSRGMVKEDSSTSFSKAVIPVCLLWLCCALGLSPATLKAQTTGALLKSVQRATPAQRRILNPGSVPSWFQTGMFTTARWDGGPIEAEKGSISGWPGWTQGDPLQMLQATRDWYSPRTIEFLKMAHINWAWVTWSTGFSPATELQQRDLVSRYIKLCHQNHIHVTAYISIGNMFWEDMFEHVPASSAWTDFDFHGAPVYYGACHAVGSWDTPCTLRYMADITNPGWIELQKERVEEAARAGADGLWIDNTMSSYRAQDVAHLIDVLYGVASKINPTFVIESNYNKSIYTWARYQNAVSTEDGQEPGYYTDKQQPYLVTNAGLIRYNYGVSEGWRPVSLEDGGRHTGERMMNPMPPRKWQLAIAESAMYHASLEINPEGRFLRDIYFEVPAAMDGLRAIGVYNGFLEQNEQYYTDPESLSRVAILSDATDAVVPYLNQISEKDLNYDVIFNYQIPREELLKQYKVIVLPNTNPLNRVWCEVLANWVREDGGTLIVVQDASLFSSSPVPGNQDFGLGKLLGISKREIPPSMKVIPQGKGSGVYLPSPVPAGEMVSLIQSYVKQSELLKVDSRDAVLSNVAYQPRYRRIVLHLLNYRQELEKGLCVEVRAPIEKVEILSPDHLSETKAQVARHGNSSKVIVPELQTYDLIAIYLSGKY